MDSNEDIINAARSRLWGLGRQISVDAFSEIINRDAKIYIVYGTDRTHVWNHSYLGKVLGLVEDYYVEERDHAVTTIAYRHCILIEIQQNQASLIDFFDELNSYIDDGYIAGEFRIEIRDGILYVPLPTKGHND